MYKKRSLLLLFLLVVLCVGSSRITYAAQEKFRFAFGDADCSLTPLQVRSDINSIVDHKEVDGPQPDELFTIKRDSKNTSYVDWFSKKQLKSYLDKEGEPQKYAYRVSCLTDYAHKHSNNHVEIKKHDVGKNKSCEYSVPHFQTVDDNVPDQFVEKYNLYDAFPEKFESNGILLKYGVGEIIKKYGEDGGYVGQQLQISVPALLDVTTKDKERFKEIVVAQYTFNNGHKKACYDERGQFIEPAFDECGVPLPSKYSKAVYHRALKPLKMSGKHGPELVNLSNSKTNGVVSTGIAKCVLEACKGLYLDKEEQSPNTRSMAEFLSDGIYDIKAFSELEKPYLERVGYSIES